MKKFLIKMALIAFPVFALSDPAPFGLEISKTTVAQMKAKYHVSKPAIEYLQGAKYTTYTLNVAELDFEGLKDAHATFDEKGVLTQVLTFFDKIKFDYLHDALGKKYKLLKEEIPFVGNKSAYFEDGNTIITVDAPHLSFEMKVIYTERDALQKAIDHANAQKQKKQSTEHAKL